MAGALLCSCSSNVLLGTQTASSKILNPNFAVRVMKPRGNNLGGRSIVAQSSKSGNVDGSNEATKDSPSWANLDSDELPPWARSEKQKDMLEKNDPPYIVFLLGSAISAIAAIGSIFEFMNKHPVFGFLSSDSVFYTPLLGFFVLVGFPCSALLWFKSVQVANKESEEQDRKDGYFE